MSIYKSSSSMPQLTGLSCIIYYNVSVFKKNSNRALFDLTFFFLLSTGIFVKYFILLTVLFFSCFHSFLKNSTKFLLFLNAFYETFKF